jgi:aldose 1-epimerase
MKAATLAPALELQAGALRLALRPDLGGAIAGFWHDTTPVLHSCEAAELKASRPSACFPLAPYSNRIGYRHFRWLGRDFTTAPNFDQGNPHSLHGTVWREPWRVSGSNAARAELAVAHRADAHWPFNFDATQSFELNDHALTLRLTLTNIDSRTQPVGVGWHPYFPKRSRSRLHIECGQRWESDPTTQLPTRRVQQGSIDGEVRHLDFDNCFEGWRGAASLRDEKLALKLTSSLPYVVVFTPTERDYFCVEPVSHVSNAIQMGDPAAHGLVALTAGDRIEAWMTIEVAKA